jgi:hypothetical protein
MVNHIQASNSWRDGFRKLIQQGNESSDFGPPGFTLPDLELLCNMPVRWDSTFLMINQVILM